MGEHVVALLLRWRWPISGDIESRLRTDKRMEHDSVGAGGGIVVVVVREEVAQQCIESRAAPRTSGEGRVWGCSVESPLLIVSVHVVMPNLGYSVLYTLQGTLVDEVPSYAAPPGVCFASWAQFVEQ
jgi:hypothetical protein